MTSDSFSEDLQIQRRSHIAYFYGACIIFLELEISSPHPLAVWGMESTSSCVPQNKIRLTGLKQHEHESSVFTLDSLGLVLQCPGPLSVHWHLNTESKDTEPKGVGIDSQPDFISFYYVFHDGNY